MKITEIEAIPVEIPRTPNLNLTSVYGLIPSARFVIVVVRTDEGLEGLGEASPELGWTGEDLHSCFYCIRNHLEPALVGQDPRRIQTALSTMDALVSFNPYAKAAIEMALWDILGKASDLPLAELWGGRVRERVAVKFVVSGQPEHAAENAQKAVESGFRFIKIKTGRDVGDDIQRVRAVREALGEEIPVGVDSNMGWSYVEACRALPQLEEIGIAFIEQPFNRYPREALVEYRRRSSIPIVAHESLFILNDALELLASRAVDIWAITPSAHGGYLPTQEILALARAGRLPCLLGSTLELGINSAFMAHIGLSAPSIDGTVPSDIIGPFYYPEDVVTEQLVLEEGGVKPPDGAGLGVSLDHETLAKYRVDAS